SSCMARWAAEALFPCTSMRKEKPWGRRCCEWRSSWMNTSLDCSREGRLLRIALNRPDKRNALTNALCRQLLDAIHEAGADDGVGAILFEGRGSVFCAGMDLDEAAQP